MDAKDMYVGMRVKTTVPFVSLKAGEPGTVVEDYDTGFMIEWDDPKLGWGNKKLRDGFDKERDCQFLEPLNG